MTVLGIVWRDESEFTLEVDGISVFVADYDTFGTRGMDSAKAMVQALADRMGIEFDETTLCGSCGAPSDQECENCEEHECDCVCCEHGYPHGEDCEECGE